MARIRRKITRTGAKPTKKRKVITLTDEEKAKRRAEDEALAKQLRSVKNWIVAPAGAPPHELEGDDYESVADWVKKLKNNDSGHTVQSCQYWVKYFFDPFQQKDQWKAVRGIIEEHHETFGIPNLPRATYTPTKEDKKNRIGWE
tara:strand:+ start:733 stop:1164 length:432 start_codon:yes stop_codon:yes gene_type:complete